ncbi:MAG: DUF5666 domain-containing protein [Candidatus Acidiferrales bacterium]
MDCKFLCLLNFLCLAVAAPSPAQTPDAPPQAQEQGTSPRGNRGQGRGGPMEGRGIAGKITAINGGSLEIAKPDGTSVIVKLTDKTEFRRDRQPAKITDFKVGDLVFVRGDENADHIFIAQVIGARTGNGPGGGGGFGEMGKDFVAGEVKSIDPPKLSILRTDDVTQTLELTEDTSLRKGRDSITMADIHPGDHVVIRGAPQNDVFVPKNVMVLSPEQWQRLQQMAGGRGGPAANVPPNAPTSNSPQP